MFAKAEHPLTLFLDDLQWLDAATLDLIEVLPTQANVRNLLLVGAYRDNEVDAGHPIMRMVDAIRTAGGKVAGIALAPLKPEHLGQLVADALRCESERAVSLAQLVHEKTAGNPFFAIQFISSLAEDGLLGFDHSSSGWLWDVDRIRGETNKDNVADLMVGKLARLPDDAKEALRQMACLGNVVEISRLATILGAPEVDVHAAMWKAVQVDLVERLSGAYRFVHDRVQESAYSQIPQTQRAAAHLRIGRLLVAQTPPEKREDAIFEIVNHLNRGATLISESEEREQLADLNLIAGKRAKASTAYASALTHFASGAALLPEGAWGRRADLAFALELGLAECEYLTGALAKADIRLADLARRALKLPDLAAVARLREDLYMTLGRSDHAVDVCLDYLPHVGIMWSAHPTKQEVRREYERLWRQIGSRSIEELLELPPMTAPEWIATMEVLTKAVTPAKFTDQNLHSLVIGRMANLSLEHGNSDASCYGYALVGAVLGSEFGDYGASSRFGQLGLDLVEQRGLTRFEAGVYLVLAIDIFPWTQAIRGGRSLSQRALDAAERSGDRTFSGYSCAVWIFDLIAAGDPLGDAQREAEAKLAFVRKQKFGLQVDIIAPPLQFIRTMRGLTPIFGSFNDAGFDEDSFEQHLEADPLLAIAACLYWIRKLQALLLANDYAAALAAAARAERHLWTSETFFQLAEYHFYAALARAALCNSAVGAERSQHLESLAAHHRRLQSWASNCPENFENRAALVGAEIARIEGREIDAERLYEQAVRSARASGLAHNEALAYELAARFYEARGFEDFALTYLQRARDGYRRWGANGKVRQLEERYPQLKMKGHLPAPTSTIQAPVESLDLATVIKVSQAISGEIVLEKLLETLMRTAIEHAGAERVLLIAARCDELRVESEATTNSEDVTVHLPDGVDASPVMPELLVRYVVRTGETVILDDASSPNPFAADPYLVQRPSRSILCLPLINKAKVTGVLLLENNLTPRVFAPARISALTLIASHAAIALENARLYRELQEREKQQTTTSKILRIISNSPIQSVLDAVAENAAHLSDAGNAEIFRLEDNLLRLVASYGNIPVVVHAHQGIAANRDTVTGRAACDRRTVHVHDLAAEEDEYPVGSSNAKREGHRTTLATPLLHEDAPVGIILVRRREVRPFSDEEIALIETFADHAVIAIENARLFEAEKQRALALAHANRDLRDRERKIRRLVESNIIGVFFGDFDGRILEANDAFLRIVGYDRVDLAAGRINWKDMTPGDWRDRDAGWIVEHKRTGVLQPIEKEYFRKDGSRVPILLGAASFEEGGNESVTFVLDLTERKQAEENLRRSSEALRRSEAYLEEAERLSHTGTWVFNAASMTYVYWSDESYRIWGFDRLEGIPNRDAIRQRIHPADRDRVYDLGQEAARQKRDYAVAYRLVLPDGDIKYLEAISRHLFSALGELVEVVGTHVDVTERKRSEHALQESEYKLRQIIDTVPGLIWSTDPIGSPTHVSQRLLDYSGLHFEDFKHVGWKPVVHPDDYLQTEKAYRHAIQTGTSYHGVLRLRRADGEYRWHHARCEPLRDQQGHVIQWYGLSVEVDEAQLQAILNVIPANTWYAVPSGALTFANNRTADSLGLPKDHPLRFGVDIGAPWDAHIQLLHPDDQDGSRKVWSQCLRTGEAGEVSFRVRNAQGGYRWFLTRAEPLRASDGTLLLWVGVNLDIEELKCAEQALRESEAKFRDYAETASDWFWEIDPDYKFTQLTENAFGSNAANRIGLACWDHALDRETEPEKWRLVSAALDARQPFRDFVYCALGGDGAPMSVRSSGKPVFDANGRFLGYRGTGSDVTATMRALEEHERLRQLESDLAHMNRLSMMGELAASLAHEIAQPVGSARNNARAALNFLDKHPPDLREVMEALTCVVGDAGRAGAIIDRIRAYIKKAPPKSDRFDLNQAINEVVALARSEIGKNGVSVHTRLTERMAPVSGDRVQLQQVLLNLILNAIEAMSGFGDGPRDLTITSEQSRTSGFLVTVRDSGPGIDPERLERVFDAFYTTKSSGVGMGLSICRSIVSAHGGQLWAERNTPRGAAFQFTLPNASGTP